MRSRSSSGSAPGSNFASWNLRMAYFVPRINFARARCAKTVSFPWMRRSQRRWDRASPFHVIFRQ